jgi:cysteine synthase A
LNIHKSYYETLYSRPVVALSGYCAKYDLPDSLYAYLAYGGTTGSAKDALWPQKKAFCSRARR